MEVAVATATHHNAEAGPSRLRPPTLPFTLDLTCPIALPPRPAGEVSWPYHVAGATLPESEDMEQYFRRRYLETLHLSDLLAPIPHLISDLKATVTSGGDHNTHLLAQLISPYLLTLPQIENRHRKALAPLIRSLITTKSTESSHEVRRDILAEAVRSGVIAKDEVDVLEASLDLRTNSRAASEGAAVVAKAWTDELEKRETMMQVALLFLYISLDPPPMAPKKRKRSRRGSVGEARATEDPRGALELLIDRISVWSAVAELGIGVDDRGDAASKSKGKGREEENITTILKRFWRQVIKAEFLSAQRDLCDSFHLKVFGTALPPPEPPATTKKPRKPAMTRARPSTDALTQPNMPRPSISGRTSRTPSETGSRMSPPKMQREGSVNSLHGRSFDREGSSFSRTYSRAGDTVEESVRPRSRSQSIDPASAPVRPGITERSSLDVPKKGIMRAPSGKDLFKGREVGFMRRSTSSAISLKKVKASIGRTDSQSQQRLGLLGRKTSDPVKARRNSQEAQTQSRESQGTLVFATPSKPRSGIFGSRVGSFVAPTPMREEPASGSRSEAGFTRQAFITETPVAQGRIARDDRYALGSGVAETPTNEHSGGVREVPKQGSSGPRAFGSFAITTLNEEAVLDSGDESDDPLGNLMVMTDEEISDDEGDSQRLPIVPETPAKS